MSSNDLVELFELLLQLGDVSLHSSVVRQSSFILASLLTFSALFFALQFLTRFLLFSAPM